MLILMQTSSYMKNISFNFTDCKIMESFISSLTCLFVSLKVLRSVSK